VQLEMQDAVAAMHIALAAMNIDEFVEKCVEKICELESKPSAYIKPIINLNKSNYVIGFIVFQNQIKIKITDFMILLLFCCTVYF
jgi:hypothetical protein